MRLSLNDDVIITTLFNDGSEIYWNASIYSKIKELSARSLTLFRETNDFLAWLPPDKLKAVEDYYRTVGATFARASAKHTTTDKEFIAVVDVITEEITVATGKFFKSITLDLIKEWSSQYNGINIPDLGEKHNVVYTVEGTYLREDYIKLVDLCIAIRLMVPVWCEYISTVDTVVASNKYEVSCIELLRDAPGIIESEAMRKLSSYIEEKSQLEIGKAATAIINGMPRSRIPEWILSITIVRRIGVGDISADDVRGNLITSIYGFVQGILNRDLDRKNAGTVRDKFRDDKSSDEFEKQSLIEQYRIKQDITEGDCSMYETWIVTYPERAALELVKHREMTKEELALYMKRVKTCIAYAEKLNELSLIDVQYTLLGWIVNDIVPYQLICRVDPKTGHLAGRLDPAAKRKLLGIAQGFAWYFNLSDIAIALTALHDVDFESNGLVAAPSFRLSPNMNERLSARYDQFHPNAPEAAADADYQRSNNVAAKAVREVIRGFNNKTFKARVPPELWDTAGSFQRSGTVVFRGVSEQTVLLIETLCEV